MENPATWNKCIKVLNSELNWGVEFNSNKLIAETIIILVNHNLFIVDENNSEVLNTIRKSILDFKYEIDNEICGNSLGSKIYYSLKQIKAVE